MRTEDNSSLLRPAHTQTEGGETVEETEGPSGQTGHGQPSGQTGWRQSGQENSWTESSLMVERPDQTWMGLKTHLDEPEENELPEKAAQVFYPMATKQSEGLWERESEKSPFLDQHAQQYEWMEETPSNKCGQCCPGRDVLKVSVSLVTSALFFPFLVWGGFVFLPFDAPLLDDAPLRLVYTLRCSVFAATPILLGWLVLGIIRLRSGSLKPLFDDVKGAELYEITVHRRFVSDSASLFLIYFLHLVVLAMYLGQEQLKLIPLLTIVFALGRLVYWVAAAFGSSIRGFGFGLSFLPSLAMMVANIYFIFTVEGSIFNQPTMSGKSMTPPQGRQRFWG